MGTSASLSDPDVSSSEQSIDTVIYVPGSKSRHRQHSSAVRKPSPASASLPASHERVISEMSNGSPQMVSPYNVTGAVIVFLVCEEF